MRITRLTPQFIDKRLHIFFAAHVHHISSSHEGSLGFANRFGRGISHDDLAPLLLKEQYFIARPQVEYPPNFSGYGNLPARGDFCHVHKDPLPQ